MSDVSSVVVVKIMITRHSKFNHLSKSRQLARGEAFQENVAGHFV